MCVCVCGCPSGDFVAECWRDGVELCLREGRAWRSLLCVGGVLASLGSMAIVFAQRSLWSPVGVGPDTSSLAVGHAVLAVVNDSKRYARDDVSVSEGARVRVLKEEGCVQLGCDGENSSHHGVRAVEVARSAPGSGVRVHRTDWRCPDKVYLGQLCDVKMHYIA